MLNTILGTNTFYDSETCLIGEGHLLDSLDTVRLLVFCSESFSFEEILDDLYLGSISTIDSLVNMIYDNVQEEAEQSGF